MLRQKGKGGHACLGGVLEIFAAAVPDVSAAWCCAWSVTRMQ